MSHIVDMPCKVTSLQALEMAATAIGLELVRDQKTFKSYFEGQCEHALRLKKVEGDRNAWRAPYEIGIVANTDGKPGFTLKWDTFGGGYGLEHIVGTEGHNLFKEYAAQETVLDMWENGYQTEIERKENGEIVVMGSR